MRMYSSVVTMAAVTLLNGRLRRKPVSRQPAVAGQPTEAGLSHQVESTGPFTGDDVTIVVPVLDNPDGAARLGETTGVAKVVVVDDGSTPPLAAATVRHHRPAGPAAARNAGARLVGTDLIAFVDSDVLLEPGWLEELLPLFADPHVAMAAPRVLAAPGRGALARYEADRCPLDLGPDPVSIRPGAPLGFVPSAAIVVRRSALTDVGGFDEELRYGEDVDLVWRLVAAGWTVRYHPAAVVRHRSRESLRAWLRQRYGYGTGHGALAHRHPGVLAPVWLSQTNAAAFALYASGHPAAGAAIAAGISGLLRQPDVRAAEALAVAARGHIGAARLTAAAMRRAWWPAALITRRGRVLLALSLLPCLVRAAGRSGDLDRGRWLILRIADDLAFGAGVWTGCVRHRSVEPLLPILE